MKYGLTLVSRRAYEPESYWERTERGLTLSSYIEDSNRTRKYITNDINMAFHQFNYLSLKLAERKDDFPASDYYWVVEEFPEINFMGGDLSGSTAGPQVIGEDTLIDKNISELQLPNDRAFIDDMKALIKDISGSGSFTDSEEKLYQELLQAFNKKSSNPEASNVSVLTNPYLTLEIGMPGVERQ